MSIFRRGECWYASYSFNGKRVKESLGTKDKKQAQELHDKRKAELWRVSVLGETPKVTFEVACTRWLEEKANKKSLDDDKTKIIFWLDHFEGVYLSDIDESSIYNAVSKLTNQKQAENWEKHVSGKKRRQVKKKISPVSVATKAAYLAFIKSLLRSAERDWKYLDKAPNIKVPKPKNNRIRWLEPHEAKRLIDECSEPLKSVVTFTLATGLRRSNIVNLEWSQIDMQKKFARIHPDQTKSGKALGVALNDTACRVLKQQIGNHHNYVFVHSKAKNRSDGTMTPTVRKMRVDSNTSFRTALKRAGIENFRFHDLRHTWASWLIQNGTPLSVLQEMGGWESIEMVRRYAHLAPSHLTEHAQKIDALFHDEVSNMSHPALSIVGEHK
ncbi:tyrosine-type recombinase/integrase [Xenorhabdus bovienii]|uniref:Putative integrase DLP12 prophage n=1 Tax=Xenorhabdus bovienii str. kraussei Becker Underwood TaxID=1398204 RepID=A0A077PQ67_XENBV|nr:site-specific integrase [Xenorhabdus bovienii]CDH23158.1 putative integrase; DLP12 prophage [Xenorhabdus bovienii str. kraussei Becker Underwood]